MGVFDRLFGKGRGEAATRAKKAELRGELTRAIELWVEAERPHEAARVMLLRGDAEQDGRLRLQHYIQASRTAPPGHEVQRLAVRKRAELTILLASGSALSAVARRDVIEAARDLEEIGEQAKAAEAFALAGDKESEARALQGAGDVDGLEDLLSSEQEKERALRRRSGARAEIELLVTSGRRREALVAAESLSKSDPDSLPARELVESLRSRRAAGTIANVVLRGKRLALVLGNEVVIGRTEGSLLAPSHAVSRRHLRISRVNGEPSLQDLESRNGTQLRGMNVVGALTVGEGVELKLGGEVGLRLRPSLELSGALEIELAGEKYVAPMGPASLGIGGWRLDPGQDGWLELVSGDPEAFLKGVALVPRVTLLVGDAISETRGGTPAIEILGT